MRGILLFFLLIFSSLNAQNLDTLLQIYEKENDLSKKTKKEAAGNVKVYTRQDLQRMQIRSLEELYRSIPYYRYNQNNLGLTDLAYNGYIESTSNEARLYINEREVNTPYFGSGVYLISQLDFDYIDHVEVYYGVTTFEFGIEPAKMVIKIYTKNPDRENGGEVNLAFGSHKSTDASVSFAKIFDDFSLYAYLSKKNKNYTKVRRANNSILSKDKASTHFFISLESENHRLEYNNINASTDLFMFGLKDSPIENNGDAMYHLLGWYSKWLDDKLSLSLDYVFLTATSKQVDDEAIRTMPYNGLEIPLYEVSMTNHEYSLSGLVKYKEQIQNHNLLVGTFFRKKSFENKKLSVGTKIFGNTIKKDIDGFKLPFENENIYGAFIEDDYALSDNQMLVAALKYDFISVDSDEFKKQNLLFTRLGYIYTSEDFSFKSFYTRYDLSFEPFIYFYAKDSKEVKNQTSQNVFLEFDWKKNRYKYDLNMFYTKEKNSIDYKYTNSPQPYISKGVSFAVGYNFDFNNKVETNIFLANKKIKKYGVDDTYYGGNLRFLNTYKKIDFYNELVYRGGYDGLSDGYDLNSAITLNITKDFSVFLKGENVLNKALQTRFYKKEIGNKQLFTEPMSVLDRRFYLGLEYRF